MLSTVPILNLEQLDLSGDVEVQMSDLTEDSLKSLVLGDIIDGYLFFPSGIMSGTESGRYISQGGGGLQFRFDLERSDRANRTRGSPGGSWCW